jgi:hypothetical protein
MSGQGDEALPELKVKRGGGVGVAVLFALVGLAGAGAGLWYFVLRADPAEAQAAFRREVLAPAHQGYYEQFWQCAMTVPLSTFSNNAELIARINKNSAGMDGTRYGRHLLEDEKCLPRLNDGIVEFRLLKGNPLTPEAYAPLLDELVGEVEEVNRAWTEYAQFVSQADFRQELRDAIKTKGEAYAGYEGAVEHRNNARKTKYRKGALHYYHFIQCVLGETSYTSFQSSRSRRTGAHHKLIETLDGLCQAGGDEFRNHIEQVCRDLLWNLESDVREDDFENAVKHWVRNGGDYGSAVPVLECLETAEEGNRNKYINNIAKAWYDYGKTSRRIIDMSKTTAGS